VAGEVIVMVYLHDSPVIALHRCANVKHSPVFVKVALLLSKLAQLFNKHSPVLNEVAQLFGKAAQRITIGGANLKFHS